MTCTECRKRIPKRRSGQRPSRLRTVVTRTRTRTRRPFRLRRLLLGTENRAAEQHAAGCLTCGIACVQCPRPQVSA